MKWIFLALLLAFPAEAGISDVVSLLREMQKASTADAASELEIWGKVKCQCDTKHEDFTTTITARAETIADKEGQIESLMASTGKKSLDKAQSEQQRSDSIKDLATMQGQRDKENGEWFADDKLMNFQEGQLRNAIVTLQEVGADQTQGSSADHTTYLKGNVEENALLQVQVRTALAKAHDLLQTPGGTYSAQSGQIVGILKQFLDQTVADIKNANELEAARKEAFRKYRNTQLDIQIRLNLRIARLSGEIGANDAQLGLARSARTTAIEDKELNEDALAENTEHCNEQETIFNTRKGIRAQEDSALSQAVAILTDDTAFDNVAEEEALRDGAGVKDRDIQSFLQIRQKEAHVQGTLRRQALRLLSGATSHQAGKLRALLRMGNPFNTILAEIKKMEKVIDQEAKVDQETHDEYKQDMIDTKATLKSKRADKQELNGQITKLTDQVDDLKEALVNTRKAVQKSRDDLETTRNNRKEEHVEYMHEMVTINTTNKIITRAVDVLSKFYDWLQRRSGAHSYSEHANTSCAGDQKGKTFNDADADELKRECTAAPECSGFFVYGTATGGYLFNNVLPQSEWRQSEEQAGGAAGDCWTKEYGTGETAIVKKEASDNKLMGDRSEGLNNHYSSVQGEGGGTGAGVIKLLETIRDEGTTEALAETSSEEKSQAEFEKYVATTNADIRRGEETDAACDNELARQTIVLQQKKEQKAAVQESIDTNQAFKDKIQPSHDFWLKNLALRKERQVAEKTQLKKVRGLLRNSKVYKKHSNKAKQQAEVEKYGKECAEILAGNRDQYGNNEITTAEGEACKRGIRVTGYCNGEGKGTTECAGQ